MTLSTPINKHTVCLSFLAVAMLYVTAKVVCNPMFFRVTDVDIWGLVFRFSAAALIYPLIYILSDVLVYLENRNKAIIVVIIGIICDGLFSYALSLSHMLPHAQAMAPNEALHSNAIDIIAPLMPALWYHGILATLIAGIAEILLFSFLLKRIKNFGLSTVISVATTIAIHNATLDYQILKEYPDVMWRIISNYSLNMTVVIIYTIIISIILSVRKKQRVVA
jgi:uncharacterized PurR-regulated membrane protein YhhQ (DUF165 family)